MSKINVLDQNTINKIAAGEVIERPAAVVKELVENSIDAGANAITIEIKEGGISFIRITDNGSGIPKEDISFAFQRHATSKIKSVEDLLHVSSLGFRGEALSSIASVSQVELVTKAQGAFIGCRYLIEGGMEKTFEEIGCPEGTTFLVRNLFFNTPARRKFLKSPTTEAGYISDFVEKLAVSHPGISFKFINNNQIKLQTSGNGNLKDIIYHIYGRDIAANLIALEINKNNIQIQGFIGKPVISRGNRNYMNYFINGRYIKSSLINNAIEEAYKSYSMAHRYPFSTLHFHIPSSHIDVNVHPTKMEIRFSNKEELYQLITETISSQLKQKEFIPQVKLVEEKPVVEKPSVSIPEPFEKKRLETFRSTNIPETVNIQPKINEPLLIKESPIYSTEPIKSIEPVKPVEQLDLFEKKLLSKESQKDHRIIGQLFSTYWIVEFQDKMFLMDQHAAHEKVLFEKIMKDMENKQFASQMVMPPIILSLSMKEEETLKKYLPELNAMGFEIEHFGGREYSVRGVPGNLPSIAENDLLLSLLDSLVAENGHNSGTILVEKIASMSCKAAVKGNNTLSFEEAKTLIDRLLELENPYHCPHGRPTIISMSKYEIEKKFKRIL